MRSTEMTDAEALIICDSIRNEIMTQNQALYDRLRKANAIAKVMNLAICAIEQKEAHKE